MTRGTHPAPGPERSARVRAVVVSWNGAHLLPDCLDSLLTQTIAAELEIVVVDNASVDLTAELLATRYPSVSVIRSELNLGFAGGADLGIAGFTGEFVALLNNDATFAVDALERMTAVMAAPGHDEVGAVTAKILLAGSYRLEPDLPEQGVPTGSFRRDDGWLVPAEAGSPGAVQVVNSTGNIVNSHGAGADRDWLRTEGEESHAVDVFGFCGGAALLRTTALADVGGFDPALFLYYEDTDLSWRLRAGGWTVRYCEQAVARHLHAASSDAASPLFRFYNTRNSLVVLTRHAPARLAATAFGRQVAGSALAALRHAEPRPVTAARVRGLAAYVRRLPRTLGERARWRGLPVDRAEVARLLH